jgi:uncharacterized membrane protein
VLGATDDTWTKTGNVYALGIYYWRVWAISSAGENVSENTWKFTVTARAGVSISISPGSPQENQRGGTLTYTVTVVNTGNAVDNYNLRVWDNPGLYDNVPLENWEPTLDNYSLKNIPPGENKTTKLRVTVSLYSPPGTSDNIIIRATSAENENVYAEKLCVASSKLSDAKFSAIDDANIQEKTPDNNYGTDWLYVGRLDDGAVRSFLKFELSGIPLTSNIDVAQLWLHDNNTPTPPTPRTINCYQVNNDNWSEDTITWNKQPSIDNLLDSRSVVSGFHWYSWNVTSFVTHEFGGDNKVSLAMISDKENTPPDYSVSFVSKEVRPPEENENKESWDPYLKVVYSPMFPSSPLVTISPSYIYDYPGKTIFYLVMVKNVGWENSSYTLENVDTLGWANISLKDVRFDNMQPEENRTTWLQVMIPDNANPGTVDSIIIRARSVENHNIWDERLCTVGFLPPTVSISPSYEEDLRGENLAYTVRVTNPGTITENFILSVRDNAVPSWNPTLDNYLLTIPAESYIDNTLRVTVSWNSVPATSDIITIRATSAENENIYGEDSCIAHSKPLEMKIHPPTDDAQVRGSAPDSNYGDTPLYVGRIDDNSARSFLKFDLSSLPSSTIENARLYLYVGRGWISYGGENVRCYRVDNDNWSEDAITWDNKPSIDNLLDNKPVTEEGNWYFWDVTSFVASESGGDNKASFCMVGAGENIPPDHYVEFWNKEFGSSDYEPYLLVDYKPSSDATLASISISPEKQSRLRGNTLEYTVTVQNQGWDNMDYSLYVSDNAVPSWGPTLSENLLEDVLPGENRVATLTVTVPENASPCTSDNIVVSAILFDNQSISASCVAHSAVFTMGVTISPQEDTTLKGRTLEYTVTLTNLNTDNALPDNYTLSFKENLGERVYPIDDAYVDNDTPNNNYGDTSDLETFPEMTFLKFDLRPLRGLIIDNALLRLWATSKNGSPSVQCLVVDNDNWSEDTITWNNKPENGGVLDNQLINSANTRYSWNVTDFVNNQFENENDQMVSFGIISSVAYENATFYSKEGTQPPYLEVIYHEADNAGWGSNISFYPENRIENVLTGRSKSVKLRVTIPEKANPGMFDNITVTARSEADDIVDNSASCVARSGILALEVSITPENQYNARGSPLSYNVTVTNRGTVRDNYNLTVRDNVVASGRPTLATYLLRDILPGGSKTTKLRVAVSWYLPLGMGDNIIVKATAVENENVWAENSCIAYPKPAENVYSIDDAYVNEDAPNNNYGDLSTLDVGNPSYHTLPRRAFLKFDIRLPGGATIDNALLWLWATNISYDEHEPYVQCWRTDNDEWTEDTITWNNQPAVGDVLDTQTIKSTNTWYSWNVTDFVKNQFENENDQIVSFCMISSDEPTSIIAYFSSKEGTQPPCLEVVYHGVNQHSVVVSISPNYISGIISSGMRRISYSVTVQNVGWENSNYTVSYIRDTLGWPLSLGSLQFNNISPGDNKKTALTVTIPPGTAPFTRDEITVQVKNNENLDVIGYTKCIAQSAPQIMSISPSENNAPRGTTLTYTVRVTNPGTIPENFVLSVRDNGWNPTLDNYSLYIQPGENENTTLRVKVSWNSPPGTRDNMTIRVALAADESVWVENLCTAYSTLDNMKIPPIDDSLVFENVANSNYGTYNLLDVGWGAEGLQGRARSFLRFYLAIPGGSAINSAQLYLASADQKNSPQVQCRAVERSILLGGTLLKNNDWNQDTITWNNRPARGEVLDSQIINVGTWYSWRATDFVSNQFQNENDRIASFSMESTGENKKVENWAKLYSKERNENERPYLLVSYSISSHSPLVTILPRDISFRDNVSYSVTVQNVGWENSSYTLENVDTLGWSIKLDDNRFDNIRPGENRTTTLRVIIPENIAENTRDEIIIKAIDNENTEVIGSAICTAHAAVISRGVAVSISPLGHPETDWRPGMNATFTVTVTNKGNIEDTYDLTASDNSGWSPTISLTTLTLTGGVSGTATLTVLIPDNSTLGMRDNIRVKATSQSDNTISTESLTEAHTTSFFRKVGVSIVPSYGENLPGGYLTFKVTVTNTGNVRDNFLLTVSDNAGWGPTLSASWVWLENGQSRPTSENLVLRVRIPNNAVEGTMDNIQVIAQSKYDNTKSDNKNCVAQVIPIRRGVGVRISPAEGTAGPGENVVFTVTVTNTGNVADNYLLTRSDSAGWTLSLDNTLLTVPASESRTTILRVTIPPGAGNNAQDIVTVTARSRTDNTIENSASCTAQAAGLVSRGVSVSISPSSQSGANGVTLTYTATVSNTSNDSDTYDLTVSDDAVWGATLDAYTLTILGGENTTVTVSVTVPSDAREGDSTMITVTATSQTNSTINGDNTCTATATGAPPSRNLLPVAIGVVVVGGAVAAIALLLLKRGIIHLSFLARRFLQCLRLQNDIPKIKHSLI